MSKTTKLREQTVDDDNPTTQDVDRAPTATVSAATVSTLKKEFVRPEISVPVDVLEATTFFQAADSGGVI